MTDEQMIVQELAGALDDVPGLERPAAYTEDADLAVLMSELSAAYASSEDTDAETLEDTELFERVMARQTPERLHNAIDSENTTAIAWLRGEDDGGIDLSESGFRGFCDVVLDDSQRTPSVQLRGPPKSAKTSTGACIAEEWRRRNPRGVIATNLTVDWSDYRVTSMSQFRRLLLGDAEYVASSYESGTPPEVDRTKPVLWFFDECSTALNARMYRHEISNQYLPWVVRFGKYRITSLHIGHTKTSIHPEFRDDEITSVFLDKTSRDSLRAYRSVDKDTGVPISSSELCPELTSVPRPVFDIDPDDPAPWSWDDS